MKIREQACENFRPFPGAPEVCDECGRLGEEHPRGGLTPQVAEAMWRVMLQHGGTCGGFAGQGISRYRMTDITEHVAVCGINWRLTEAPHLQDYTYLADSYAEPEREEVLAGHLTCKCGKVSRQRIAIENTLGQLMWLAAHIDD